MKQPTENRTQEGSSSVQVGDLANQLKAIREKVGFDLDKAAEHMHLSRQILVTLENEDLANLPEPPYVRGYLRSYARLAETDAAPLIRTYEILRGADPDAMAKHFAPLHTQRPAPRISPDTARIGVIALLVLLLVLISMIPGVRNWVQTTWNEFAYKTQQANLERQQTLAGANQPGANSTAASTQGNVTRPTTSAAQTIAADQPASTPTDLTSTAAPQSLPATNAATTNSTEPVATNTATVPSVNANTSNANNVATATNTVTPNNTSAVNPATSATLANGLPNPAVSIATAAQATAPQPQNNTNNATSVVTPPTTATTATTPAPAATPANTPTPTNPQGTEVAIRVEFSQEVWMQIRDAKGKRIFEVLGTPNTSKELNAKTPMMFKIGNAPGMKLLLNGQPYDLAPYTRGSVATFKVE